jgi:hypothetical protein
MQRGEIGALFDGEKQVVGFRDWAIDFRLDGGAIGDRWRDYRPVRWRAEAGSFWLTKQPNTEVFTGRFYSLVNGKLVLMCEKKVKAVFTRVHPLNQTINIKLEMDGVIC